MVLALIVVLLAALFTSSTMQLTSSVTKRQAQDVDNLRAFYLAEAGLSEGFEALRVGKHGQLGSLENPAVFGDGLVWVDASPTGNGRVRLEATAVCGNGRSTLALVVQPVEIPLGIFSDEDLVLDTVLLIDGYEAPEEETPLAETPVDWADLVRVKIPDADVAAGRFHFDPDLGVLLYDNVFYLVEKELPPSYGYKQSFKVADLGEGIILEVEGGQLVGEDALYYEKLLQYALQEFGYYDDAPLALDDAAVALDSDAAVFGTGGTSYDPMAGTLDSTTADPGTATTTDGSGWGGDTTGGTTDPATTDSNPGSTTTSTAPVWVELDATEGALIGSNGAISVGGYGEAVQIHGDVVPGVDEDVTVASDSWVSGDTDPRAATVELDPVEVPVVTMQNSVTHDDVLPLVISPGTIGYDAISVAADSELIIRGPATVVLGTLDLAPGAELTLDTQDGNVELFLTGALHLADGSVVTTSEQRADELSVQVATDDHLSAEAAVQLRATSQFYGTVYAPGAEVVIGSQFELYGSIAARVLDLEPGARLHYDDDVSDLMPRLISWRIDEVPAALKQTDPWMGLDQTQLAPLAEAHDLSGIDLQIDYIDLSGNTVSYSGAEASFDWSQVTSVEDQTRTDLEGWSSSGDQTGDQGNQTGDTGGKKGK